MTQLLRETESNVAIQWVCYS